jgi:hypothetical protein
LDVVFLDEPTPRNDFRTETGRNLEKSTDSEGESDVHEFMGASYTEAQFEAGLDLKLVSFARSTLPTLTFARGLERVRRGRVRGRRS